ncbi:MULTISPECIES: helix-turn-helix domain-containing protein [unclassified Akkermansia]
MYLPRWKKRSHLESLYKICAALGCDIGDIVKIL